MFFSALDDDLKKKWCSFLRICQYYVFNVSYLIGRVVVTACEMIYLQRVSENHDKSGHKHPKLPRTSSLERETAVQAKVAPPARTKSVSS